MNSLFIFPLACLVAYLVGSIPFAVLSARLFGLADPRSYGSGNPGATNVLRSGNKKAALFTLLGDALKGAIVVLLARTGELPDLAVGLAGLAAFLGHLYPVFLKFRGGKGVATAAGVLLALNPLAGLSSLGAWILLAGVSRYSSLAALAAALTAPFATLLFSGSASDVVVATLMSLGLLFTHRGNIQRLVRGQETKIGARKKT
jgi:glycerol-3-phosphate acyltransferase PlsY